MTEIRGRERERERAEKRTQKPVIVFPVDNREREKRNTLRMNVTE